MTREETFTKALSLTRQLKRLPSSTELMLEGVKKSSVQTHFGNYGILFKMLRKQVTLKKKVDNLLELMKQINLN